MKPIEKDLGDWEREASMTTECGCVVEFFDDEGKLTFDRYCEIERTVNAHAVANPPAEGIKLVLYAATDRPMFTNYVHRCLDGLSPSEVRVRVPSRVHEGSFEEMRVVVYDESLRVLAAAWRIDADETTHARVLVTSEVSPFGCPSDKRPLPARVAAVWTGVQAGLAREFPDLEENDRVSFGSTVAETLASHLRVGEVWAKAACADFVTAAVTAIGIAMLRGVGLGGGASDAIAEAVFSAIDRRHPYSRFLAAQAAREPKRKLVEFIEHALSARVAGMMIVGAAGNEDPFGLFAEQS